MSYYKKYRKKPINILNKETREKYLSMTYQSLFAEEEKLSIQKSELIYQTRSELWRAIESESTDGAWEELQIKAEKEFPPLEENIFEIFSWGRLKQERIFAIQKRTQELRVEAKKDKNSRIYKEETAARIINRKNDKNRENLYNKKNQIREIEQIEKAMPEIKKRVKKKEKDAKLSAYLGTSRIQGGEIVKKIKKQTSYPFQCPYCMDLTSKDYAHVDHIIPISNGGLSVKKNMILVCSNCNLSKSALSLRRFAKSNNLDFEKICERLEEAGKWV